MAISEQNLSCAVNQTWATRERKLPGRRLCRPVNPADAFPGLPNVRTTPVDPNVGAFLDVRGFRRVGNPKVPLPNAAARDDHAGSAVRNAGDGLASRGGRAGPDGYDVVAVDRAGRGHFAPGDPDGRDDPGGRRVRIAASKRGMPALPRGSAADELAQSAVLAGGCAESDFASPPMPVG